jgi:two-component system OmpR family sensor kinase
MSLRARLVAASILVAVIALSIAGVATYTAYSRSQLQQIDQTLQRTHEPIEELVLGGDDDDLERSIEQLAPGTFVAVQDESGATELTIAAREAGHDQITADIAGLAPPAGEPSEVDQPAFSTVRATSGSGSVRVRVSRLSDGRVLIIGESMHEAAEARKRLVLIELIVTGASAIVAGLAAWVLIRVGLRPLTRVEHTARLIAEEGDLDHEVPGATRPDEVGRLATTLNTMLQRIRGAFAERDATEGELRDSEERMRRFVADVSHELRTPLAAVGAYAELFERGARDRPEDLARAMRGIDVETARMNELVEELLLLAQLDEGRPLVSTTVDLSEVVVDAISAARTVSPAWPISLRVADVVVVEGDPGRLRQVIDNLLANVRTHTPAGTSTSIGIAALGTTAVVTVTDDGPGMTAEQAAQVFDRFSRADPSRSRSSGGSGLGMAIVRALVVAHGGTIALDTAPGRGVAIRIELPLAAPDTDVEEPRP